MNKASGGDGIPVELFQILKDDSVKVLHSTRQQFWKTQKWPQDWKRSVFILITKKDNTKECSNCYLGVLISSQQSKAQNSQSQASTVRELRTSTCSSWIQKRQRNQRSNCQYTAGSQKNQENSRKTSTSASLTTLKPFTMNHEKLENSSRGRNPRPT